MNLIKELGQELQHIENRINMCGTKELEYIDMLEEKRDLIIKNIEFIVREEKLKRGQYTNKGREVIFKWLKSKNA